MRKTLVGIAALGVAMSASPALAVTSFTNDWESGAYGGSGFVVLPAYEGWTSTFGPGIEVQYGSVAGAPHGGTHLVELDSYGNSVMSRAIDAGNYTLTFWYSDRRTFPRFRTGSMFC